MVILFDAHHVLHGLLFVVCYRFCVCVLRVVCFVLCVVCRLWFVAFGVVMSLLCVVGCVCCLCVVMCCCVLLSVAVCCVVCYVLDLFCCVWFNDRWL